MRLGSFFVRSSRFIAYVSRASARASLRFSMELTVFTDAAGRPVRIVRADTGETLPFTVQGGSDNKNTAPVCAWCHKAAQAPVVCLKCQAVCYCGPVCASGHWGAGGHYMNCQALQH